MVTVPQICDTIEHLLTAEAEAVARSSGFVQRESKLTASAFLQTLVFGWMADPGASMSQLTTMAAMRGVEISAQGLEQRFTLGAVRLARHVLERAVASAFACDPVALELLGRFRAVRLQDSTVVRLPEAWAESFPSCGGSTGAPAASLKLQVELDLLTGTIVGPHLQAGRDGDLPLLEPHEGAGDGELIVRDRGYWSTGLLSSMDGAGAYFISYYQTKTNLYGEAGERIDLLSLLSGSASSFDLPVRLSAKNRVACRLVGVRVSEAVAALRRERLAEYERKQGRTASALQVALTRWSVAVTNASVEELSLKEALVLLRARWQMEILFKIWKSEVGLDDSRSGKPARVLCEVFVKLLIGLIEHWVVLTSAWAVPERSLMKAAKSIRIVASALAVAFDSRTQFRARVAKLASTIARTCRVTKRGANPSSAQLLSSLSSEA
jgi:hypothetical protein